MLSDFKLKFFFSSYRFLFLTPPKLFLRSRSLQQPALLDSSPTAFELVQSTSFACVVYSLQNHLSVFGTRRFTPSQHTQPHPRTSSLSLAEKHFQSYPTNDTEKETSDTIARMVSIHGHRRTSGASMLLFYCLSC
jgi:hypothetical protein